MTAVPQPAAPTSSYTLTWDAWNRLVKVTDGANTVAEYQYDGDNRRIVKKLYSGGNLDETRHIYLSQGHQILEERIDSSTAVDRQFTWGTRYVDDLVFRARDADGNGSLDETLYVLQDVNWNITALADTAGTIVERFKYAPYGQSTVLDANFTADADAVSDYDWEYRFTSREYDPETALQYFRARYYHDRIGRFVGRDPQGFVDGLSLYRAYFVPNAVDPTGEDCPGCDLPNWAFGNQANNSSCVRACCAQHDQCYSNNDCTQWSWSWNVGGVIIGGGILGGVGGAVRGCMASGWISDCAGCNNDVVGCIAKCSIGDHMRGAPQYFCRRQNRPIRIPGDFPNVPAARQACCN